MLEVQLSLRFITPCLGCVRRNDYDRFERSADDTVVFMNSRWWKILDYGAKALGRHQGLVRKIRFHPKILGEVRRYERFYGPGKSHIHEAFEAKQTVRVRAILPTGIGIDDFKEIMRLAGEYRGISPFGWDRGFGQFEIEDLTTVERKDNANDEQSNSRKDTENR